MLAIVRPSCFPEVRPFNRVIHAEYDWVRFHVLAMVVASGRVFGLSAMFTASEHVFDNYAVYHGPERNKWLDPFSDCSTRYYLIGAYRDDHSMDNMNDLQDFFCKVDDPREPGISRTPLRVTPGFPGPFWPNVPANARREGWRMRNEIFLFFA